MVEMVSAGGSLRGARRGILEGLVVLLLGRAEASRRCLAASSGKSSS